MSSATSAKIGGLPGQPFSFACPSGSYISEFNGRSGSWMDGISATCTDGTKSGWYGGQGGGPFSRGSANGFTGLVTARAGHYVDRLHFTTPSGPIDPVGGTGGAEVVNTWSCPSGQKINRISGESTQYLNSIQFGCQPESLGATQVAAQPLPAPAPPVAPPPPVAQPAPAPSLLSQMFSAPAPPPPVAQPVSAVVNAPSPSNQTQQQPEPAPTSSMSSWTIFIIFTFIILIAAAVFVFIKMKPSTD